MINRHGIFKQRLRFLLLAVAVASCGVAAAADGGNLELWLASGPQCNSCSIFSEAAARRQYKEVLVYKKGESEIRVPIRRMGKADLQENILEQMAGDAGPRNPYWPVQLTVIAVRAGKVLHYGNIGESANLRAALVGDERMKPPEHPVADDPSLKETADYRSYFVREWNLEYFVAVALGDLPARTEGRLLDLQVASPSVQLGETNVILWGAGGLPIRNGLFISERIREIRVVLERELATRAPKFITLYGRGPRGDSLDTSVRRNGSVTFMHPQLPIDFPADLQSLDHVFSALRKQRGRHSMLVHVGHSGPTGIPIWGLLGTVSPADVSALGEGAATELMMVSGGCHSGLFARAVKCGFFAAHPEIIATGCQLSQEAIERSDDYLRLFFRSIDGRKRNEPPVTLEQAHWDASVRLEQHQISYTTLDALADEHFKSSPQSLPPRMGVGEIRKLRSAATPAEARALESLLKGLPADMQIDLLDIVQRNHAADKKLAGMTESSSDQRNATLNLPYRLMLPALARRLMFRSLQGSQENVKAVTACEARSFSSL